MNTKDNTPNSKTAKEEIRNKINHLGNSKKKNPGKFWKNERDPLLNKSWTIRKP